MLKNMNSLFKISRKRFSNNNYNYHHDFNPEYLAKRSPGNQLLVNFDFLRVFYYLALSVAICYNTPLYILFSRRKRHVSNPDFMLDTYAATI
jgi:hypothetical protein